MLTRILSFSQHGTIPVDDLKPLDVVISREDTLILLSDDMLKSVNLLIIKSKIQDEHIDSLNYLIQKKNIEIDDCITLSISQKETIKLQEERYVLIEDEYYKEQKKTKTYKTIMIAELALIIVLLLF